MRKDTVTEDEATLHPGVRQVLAHFEFEHLPPDLADISKPLHTLAHGMACQLEGPELTVGLRKLLEAKDCFVRAALPVGVPDRPVRPRPWPIDDNP